MPLFYGMGDSRLPDVARNDWWYREDLAVPPSFASRRATLVLDGVDHAWEIWLNGTRLGTNAGMFKRFWLEATSALRSGDLNRLAVKVARIPDDLVLLRIKVGNDGWMTWDSLD
jgi:beta-galactosidase/beta-glucuronidase